VYCLQIRDEPSDLCLAKVIDGSGYDMDLDLMLAGARSSSRANRCYLLVEAALLMPEFIQHCNRGCQGCGEIVTPKLADFDESTGRFTYAKATAADEVAGRNA
jgi:hypothetical protein